MHLIKGCIVDIFLAVLLLGSTVSAQVMPAQEVRLDVYFENPEFLTDEQLKGIKSSLGRNFDDAGVFLWIHEKGKNKYAPGEVGVKFVRDSSHRTGNRTCQVDISRSERPNATAEQIIHDIEKTTAHEIVEIYLEDYDDDPAHAYKMEGYFNWNDAQSQNLTFSKENKVRLRIYIRNDNTSYKPEQDEVAHIVPPKIHPTSNTKFAVYVMAEPMTVPLAGARVTFNGVTKLTNVRGQAEFMAPFVDQPTSYTVTAYHPDLAIKDIELIVYPPPVSAKVQHIVDIYNENLEYIPGIIKSVLGTETIEAHITFKDGSTRVVGLKTEGGLITEVSGEPYPDSTMALHISEETVERIGASEDRIGALLDAWGTDIRWKGLTFGEKLKAFLCLWA